MIDLEYGNSDSSRTTEIITITDVDANGAIGTVDRKGGRRSVRVPTPIAGGLNVGNKARVAVQPEINPLAGGVLVATAVLAIE